MYPIHHAIQQAISMFHVPVVIMHTTFTKVSGEDIRAVDSEETIQAAVDPSRSKAMERIFGGSLADGDIGVFTTAALHIDDDRSGLQSYILYNGLMYRVAQQGNWSLQTGTHVYLCHRHVAQDDIDQEFINGSV